MKLEVGMYVRTRNYIDVPSRIAKIEEIRYENFETLIFLDTYDYRDNNDIRADEIIKASFEPIDLIEVGDIAIIEYYVPRYRKRITRRFECDLLKCDEDEYVIFNNKYCSWWYGKNKYKWVNVNGYNPKIISVITKEQFESMSYKVGE